MLSAKLRPMVGRASSADLETCGGLLFNNPRMNLFVSNLGSTQGARKHVRYE